MNKRDKPPPRPTLVCFAVEDVIREVTSGRRLRPRAYLLAVSGLILRTDAAPDCDRQDWLKAINGSMLHVGPRELCIASEVICTKKERAAEGETYDMLVQMEPEHESGHILVQWESSAGECRMFVCPITWTPAGPRAIGFGELRLAPEQDRGPLSGFFSRMRKTILSN